MKRHLLNLGLLAGLALAACKSDSTTGPGTAAGTYTGTLAAGSESGVLTLTVSSTVTAMSSPMQYSLEASNAAPVNVSGQITLKGGTVITLAGTFDASGTPQLQVHSVPAAYILQGSFSPGQFRGTYTGPSGTGFFVAFPTQAGAVRVFCGIYTGSASGVWNLALAANDSVRGVAVEPSSSTELIGKLTAGSGDQPVNVTSPEDQSLSAHGTLNRTSGAGSGMWSITGGNGNWTASTTGCQ